MWGNGRFASWMCNRQISTNCVMLLYQYGAETLRNVSSTFLNLCHTKNNLVLEAKWVQPCSSINEVSRYNKCAENLTETNKIKEKRKAYPVTEFDHFDNNFLVDTGKNQVSYELHVLAGKLVHKNLGRQGQIRVHEKQHPEYEWWSSSSGWSIIVQRSF